MELLIFNSLTLPNGWKSKDMLISPRILPL